MSQLNRRTLYVVLGWFASRIPLYLMTTGHLWSWYGHKSIGDITVYLRWVDGSLKHGALPVGDNSWQYPPLVGPLLLLPKVLPGADYQGEFVRLAFIADAIVILVLLWTARRRESWLGPWFWILSVPFLGPIIYGRFDVFSAMPVVAALAILGKGVPVPGAADGRKQLNGRRWVAGALVGIGTAIKIWPGLTVFGLPRTKRGWQTIATAAFAAVAVTLTCMFAFRNGSWFLHTQGHRGIEIESIWAVPFLLARRAGVWHGRIHGHYGSLEVLGTGAGFAGKVAIASTVLVFALLAWWWWRKQWRPTVVPDATLVATLLMIVTSRVISPQYLIWLLATAAFCLLSKDTSQRRSALLILVSLPITQWIFPYNFTSLIHFHLSAILAVTLRDALLLAAAAIGFIDLWRDTVTGPFLPWRNRTAAPVSDASADSPGATAGEAGETAAVGEKEGVAAREEQESVAAQETEAAPAVSTAAHRPAETAEADPAIPAGSTPA
ncbi:MAG TPA: glycosyltransferase 87 family protein [Actinocrinis sp.]|uniref:glycosyltransferase 87 family protein n=1 Tax=Actinocrinis sp. TaxID=1920516 RepID=UPI002D5B9256|nr:glycosyltransferase 87 family protein [Actinocrinis sp.]HZU57070.1 glycosyltransferase 87 family protein [Actinocrinis sp.]